MINTASESFKARKIVIFRHFTFYEQLKFHAQLSGARKKFYNLGTRCESSKFKLLCGFWQDCTGSPEYAGRQSDEYNNSLALAQLSHLVTSVDES